jgi:hypothetical protein
MAPDPLRVTVGCVYVFVTVPAYVMVYASSAPSQVAEAVPE